MNTPICILCRRRHKVHKTANVLNYLPRSMQARAKAALHEVWMAPTRAEAERAFDQFVATYQLKYLKAAHCLAKDREALLAFYDFPAEHWVHLRTSNPVESTLGTIRHRTNRANGCVTRETMLALAYKLAMCAERRWKRIRGFHQVEKLIEGVKFQDGLAIEASAGRAA